ncbi:MAG: KH domain-containing protein [Proteobacteria bacterium]|nr:KH domain-containing protein [Pseudomonadota bacterium]
MRTVEEFGRTVEEAREKAFKSLGIGVADEADVDVEVLDEGSPGNDLGWGRKFARVKVTCRDSSARFETDVAPPEIDDEETEEAAPAPEVRKSTGRAAAPAEAPRKRGKGGARTGDEAPPERSSEKAPAARQRTERKGRREAPVSEIDDAARDLVEKIVDLMQLHVNIEEEESMDGQTVLNLVGPDQSILIGKRGQTLEALQFICNLIINKESTERRRIPLDAGSYRLRREKTLSDMAQRLARRSLEERVQIALDPMNPAERRIIHMALADDPDVETFSEGEEPDRKVIISPRH